MTEAQVLRQQKAATLLKEQCLQMEKLAHRLNTTVSVTKAQCDISQAAKISSRMRSLQTEIDAALVAFL